MENDRLKKYEEELRKKRIVTIVSYSVVITSSLFLIMYLAPDYFSPILRLFGIEGISNEETGVYTDCSKPENKDVAYCRPKLSHAEQDWRKISHGGKGSAAFSLSGN